MLNQRTINQNKVKFSPNTLYYEDNLVVLRDCFENECVDLIYLDPPFNSKADYNVLFKEKTTEDSTAQIRAFRDFWTWDAQANRAYKYLLAEAPEEVGNVIIAFHNFLGKTNMLAYLVMMGIRLLELHRVLKSTGVIFLHCDPTASHYLKLLMDSIFGIRNFRNEIIWKRTSAHSGESQSRRSYGSIHDVILYYSKSEKYKYYQQYTKYDEKYLNDFYYHKDKNGRRWRSDNLTATGIRYGESGKSWHGIDPSKKGLHWKYTIQKLDELEKAGRIHIPKKQGGVPAYVRYLDEMPGIILQDIWVDIPPVSSHAKERLGFQTQKPLKLLERIINSCTKEGDLILDPFCGCGTAVVAAQNLHRQWIGIDITMLAINLMNRRLNDMFSGIQVRIDGEPTDMEIATYFALKDRHEFQRWALLRIGAVPVGATATNPNKVKKGADEGYDGWIRFQDGSDGKVEKILVQVRSGHVHVRDIRDFRDVVTTKNAAMGIFITLEPPTGDMIKSVRTTDPYISNLRIEYPKLQIITVSELLGRKNLQLPSIISPFEEAIATKRPPHHKPSKLL